MLYRPKGSSVWWTKFKHAGATVRKSTRASNRKEAETEARRLRVEHEQNSGPGGRQPGHRFDELEAADIARAEAEGTDKATRQQTLEWIWGRMVDFFGPATDIAKVNFETVQEYIGHRRRQGVKGQTIRREVQALKRGLQIAKRRGWIPRVMDDWPLIRSDAPDEKKKGKLVHPDAVRAAIATMHADARDELLFAALTGLRAAELKRVRFDWVAPAPTGSPCPALLQLPAQATKTRHPRTVGLSQYALDILRQRSHSGNELVFSQANHKKALRLACERAGVPRFTLRDLRHTYATFALTGTSDAVAVQAALGHTDLRTTQLYQSSTLVRTAAASAAVEKALAAPQGSQLGGHSERPQGEIPQVFHADGRIAQWESTGLTSAQSLAISCSCCAERCRRLHGKSHTCKVEGSQKGVIVIGKRKATA